jgi:hypothetical protein
MVAFIANPWSLGFLAVLGGWIVKKLLPAIFITLGIGTVVLTGVNELTDELQAVAYASLGSLPGNLVSWVAYLRIDDAVAIIFSAHAIKWVFRLTPGGTLKKFVRF